MLHKTKGIVLSYVAYKETSVICQIFTEKFGLESFIENGVRTAKGRNKLALFQPLSILDLVVYQHPKKEVQRIAEFKAAYFYHTAYTDLSKSSILMFLAEVISKSLHGKEHNETLFGYIENSLMLLDGLENGYEDFHIHFLWQMSFYLGFGAADQNEILDQLELHGYKIKPNDSLLLGQLYNADFGKSFTQNRHERNQILDLIIGYYGLHNDRFLNIKSIPVLRGLF